MKLLKTAAIAACVLSLNTIANAGHHVYLQNNSDEHMTGAAGISPCSSIAGSTGIIAPGQTFEVPSGVLGLYCMFGCNVSVYASKSCSGNQIATVHLNKDHSIARVDNLSTHYKISASGEMITAENTSVFKNLFNLLFG